MTKELIDAMSREELEARKAAIGEALENADAEQMDAFTEERTLIDARFEQLEREAEESRKAAEAVASGAGKVIETRKEDKAMTNMEVRNTPE